MVSRCVIAALPGSLPFKFSERQLCWPIDVPDLRVLFLMNLLVVYVAFVSHIDMLR
jgi:hypothetical protein